MIFHVVKQIPVKYPIYSFYRYTFSAGMTLSHGISMRSRRMCSGVKRSGSNDSEAVSQKTEDLVNGT